MNTRPQKPHELVMELRLRERVMELEPLELEPLDMTRQCLLVATEEAILTIVKLQGCFGSSCRIALLI